MKRYRSFVLLLLAALALPAYAPQAQRVASASARSGAPGSDWAFEHSDIPVEPGYRFGRLPNGMRYAVRHNAMPRGTAQIRLEIAAGAVDESDGERGFAHFVEHMAFNGSTNVPEGEMVRLLERNGLAFGADTNASTGFQNTTYMLDLPRNDTKLLDVALMLMRETASELTISPEAVDRERGVIFSEMRDRNNWQMRNSLDQATFLHPSALYPRRFPIGATETLTAATAEGLRTFWRREYVPSQATVIVVGDFDPAVVQAMIIARFSDWRPEPAERQPDPGPIDPKSRGRTEIYMDPALSERIVASRHGKWIEGADTIAQRRENLLRQIGYGIVNRRLQRISRRADPPFHAAGFGTADVFRTGRTTNLVVDTIDAKWQRGLSAAALEYRRALKFGFTAGEIAEQLANVRTSAENSAASADTRSNAALTFAIFDLLRNEMVPSSPQSVLERLNAFMPDITPASVLAAMKREVVPLKAPLLRFQGRKQPEGGEAAIRSTWQQAMRSKLEPESGGNATGFAYTSFGQPGTVVSDTIEPALGIRRLQFANGVRLNFKRTDIEKDRVLVSVALDGGEMLNTRDNPLATQMVSNLPVGGLGKHTQDELQSILAGRTVSAGMSSTGDAFVSVAQTTPRDLELQMQLFAAFLTDPAYRPEGEIQYRLNINNFFAQQRATPSSALQNELGGILSDKDPRFTLQPVDAYRKLTFAKLKTDLSDRLAHGALEVAIVGDIDDARAIALVAKTLGALPAREPVFQAYDSQRARTFTADRSRRIVRHTGPKDQALLRLTWPTCDDSDPVEDAALELIERVVRIELTETLREKLGKAYSPSASSSTSHNWRGYGTFAIAASVDAHEVPATRDAIVQTIVELRDVPITDDLLQRARQPLIESYDNALKTNGSWLSLVSRAQGEPERIERHLHEKERLLALTPFDLQKVVQRYLEPRDAVEILVLPEGVAVPRAGK
jgi:zinc protease